MERVISQRELRNDSGAVLREVQSGRSLVVTRNGVPVAELRPVATGRFVPRAVIAAAIEGAPPVDLEAFRADLDAVVDQAVDA
jgi:prevent-host-death family protein